MKCSVKHYSTWNIPRSITFSCYIAENRFPLGQCLNSILPKKSGSVLVLITSCAITTTNSRVLLQHSLEIDNRVILRQILKTGSRVILQHTRNRQQSHLAADSENRQQSHLTVHSRNSQQSHLAADPENRQQSHLTSNSRNRQLARNKAWL